MEPPLDPLARMLATPEFVSRDIIFGRRPATSRDAHTLQLAGLWVAGSLAALGASTVAIVGTRAPTDAGRRLATRIASELAQAGVTIVSGLALGIDAAAHTGALAAGGATIGILGGGHRRFFPLRNLGLAQRMLAQQGAVLSPYEPDHPARPFQFLQRNAVVAAVADAIVVVEAAQRSGALNTAGWGADAGIAVLAVPGDVDRPKAAGCNALIRDGATLVRDADDVLAALGHEPVVKGRDAPEAIAAIDAIPFAGGVLAALAAAPGDAEALAAICNAPLGPLLGTLVRLELLGAVTRDGDAYALQPAGRATHSAGRRVLRA